MMRTMGVSDTRPADRPHLSMVGTPWFLDWVIACIGQTVPRKDEETIRDTLECFNV